MRRTSVLAIFIVLCSAMPLFAAGRAFTIEDYYRVKTISDLSVSPDGKRIAYTLTTTDLPHARREKHIWLMNVDGSKRRQITSGEKNEHSPSFSPDGTSLLFISDRDGNDNLFLLPLAGGEARQLTSISTGVDHPLWTPNGKSVIFNGSVYPECGADETCNKKIAERWKDGKLNAHRATALMYRHWTDWRDGKATHTFLLDVNDKEIRDLTPGSDDAPPFSLGGPRPYDISPDGAELAYESKEHADEAIGTNNDIWLLSLPDPGAKPRNITVANKAFDGTPRYSPDGRFIAYRLQKQAGYESDLFRLALYDRKTASSRVLTDSFLDWIEDFAWTPDSRSILFSAAHNGNTPIYRLELATGKISTLLEDETIDEFELTPDQKQLIYIHRSVGEPTEILSLSTGAGSGTKPLTDVNASFLKEVDVRPAESMWIEGAGGAKIQVFIVKPHDFDPSRKYPLILNVHGGPQGMYGDSFRGDWQVYPGAGYVVAFANGHGSTGYGQPLTAEISGDWGGMNFEDQMKVVDAMEKMPWVDSSRTGAMGWSYGGYMMNWMEGHTDRFKAIASMMGLYDLRSFYGATEELWFPEWDLQGEPWNSELYEKWSPSNFVKNFKTPALIITGEKDFRVPYTQSLQFFTALQRKNIPSELIVFPDAGHWPGWYEMALYYTAHLNWFHEHLGGEAAPWTTEAFVRNAVFDKESGKRIDRTAEPSQPAKVRNPDVIAH